MIIKFPHQASRKRALTAPAATATVDDFSRRRENISWGRHAEVAGAAGSDDPVFAAIERCRRLIQCSDAAWAAAAPDGADEDALDAMADEVFEARVALAQCTPTTWDGLEALVTFVSEQSAADKFFYFEGEECKPYAASLGRAIQCLRKGDVQK